MSNEGRKKALKDKAMVGDSGYDRIENDNYETPPENLNCLIEHTTIRGNVWECASGSGLLASTLNKFGYHVRSSDIVDYGYRVKFEIRNFLTTTEIPYKGINSIVSNPPYETVDTSKPEWEYIKPIAERYGIYTKHVSLAELFCRHAIALMRPVEGQVAMFMRNEFDCSRGRMLLFQNPPFQKKIVVTKRPRWIVGSTGSPRHNYAWFVWDWKHLSTQGFVSYSHPEDAAGPAENGA